MRGADAGLHQRGARPVVKLAVGDAGGGTGGRPAVPDVLRVGGEVVPEQQALLAGALDRRAALLRLAAVFAGYRHTGLRPGSWLSYLSRTLGRPARRVNDLPRRVAQELRVRRPGASGCPSEVLRTDGVQELAELLDFVFLLVRDRHPGLVQDLLTGEDRCTGPERERDRVRRPGAHFLPVGEDEVGEEDAVPERGDVDRVQLHPECLEHVAEQVVGQRPGGHHPLLRERDRGGFHRADPDWQVPLPLYLLEQDDGLVRGHLHPDADDLHLPHSGSVLTCAGRCQRPGVIEGILLSKYTREAGNDARALRSVIRLARADVAETGVGQRRLDQRGVQLQGDGGDFPCRLASAIPGPWAALAQYRGHHLLDQRGLPFGRCAQYPQMPGLHTVTAERHDRAGGRERVRAVPP